MATDICIRLGERVRKLRRSKGWTQTYLSEYAGFGHNYVSEIEKGKREICLRNLEILAQSLETTASELLKGL